MCVRSRSHHEYDKVVVLDRVVGTQEMFDATNRMVGALKSQRFHTVKTDPIRLVHQDDIAFAERSNVIKNGERLRSEVAYFNVANSRPLAAETKECLPGRTVVRTTDDEPGLAGIVLARRHEAQEAQRFRIVVFDPQLPWSGILGDVRDRQKED